MPVTEQGLRELLAQHAENAAPSPDLMALVDARVRRTRRRSAALAVGLVGIAVTVSLTAVPRFTGTEPTAPPAPISTSSPTPAPTPFMTKEATVEGLRVLTSGTRWIRGAGLYPFTVTVTLTNTTRVTWRGTVGVALYGSTTNAFGDPPHTPLLQLVRTSATASPSPADARWFELPVGTQRLEGYASPIIRVVDPQQNLTVSLALVDTDYGYPHTSIRGWVPVLHPDGGADARFPDPRTYPVIGFD
jgi:hypothetical protein